MLTQDVFTEHKSDYTVLKKTAVMDRYRNETNVFSPGGTINCMFTPISDEATIQTYGEKVNDMLQAIIYDDTAIEAHDQVEIAGTKYEFVSIKQYPSYRLVQVKKYEF